MTKTESLIAQLSGDLQPVVPLHPGRQAVLWLVLSATYVALATWLLGPLRENAGQQLLHAPRFAAESVLGAVAIAALGLVAFRSAVPGSLVNKWFYFALGLLGLWLAQYIYGLWQPALAPSMQGKREHCAWQTLFLAAGPAILGCLMARRFYLTRPLFTATSLALVAGMMPALHMQFACMYEPHHILRLHVLPGLAVPIAVFALGGMVALRGALRGDQLA